MILLGATSFSFNSNRVLTPTVEPVLFGNLNSELAIHFPSNS